MDEINLRPAELNDLPTLYEFEQGIVLAERPYNPLLKEGRINYYDIKALIESETSEVIVAMIDNEIIASGYVQIRPAKTYVTIEQLGYVGFMYVKPQRRGQGVSQKILEALKAWAKSRNLTELRLDVYSENHKAVSAYERFGFEKHLVEMKIHV